MGWTEVKCVGLPKVRRVWSLSGLGSNRKYGVHNMDWANMRRGLYERVLYRVENGTAREPPRPVAGVFEDLLSGIRAEVIQCTRSSRPLTRNEFVALYQDARQRAVYQRAADSLAVRPLNRSDGFLSTFVKCEKLDLSTKPDPAPRVIQPRSPRFNVELGRYLKAMEKPLCKGLAEVWGETVVMKGLDAEGVAASLKVKWDMYRDPVAIGFDATRFDQHISEDALRYEHSIYLSLVPKRHRARLGALLAMQIENVGFARCTEGYIKYVVTGRRCSGDMNTGMGNCALMVIMFLAFIRHLNIKASLGNNGDDCVLITERSNIGVILASVDKFFLDLGFVLKAEEPTDVFERIRFCQTSPVFDGERYVMCRAPLAIDKDCVSVLDLSQGFAKWAHAIGSCGTALAGGLPLYGAFYAMLLRHGKAGNTINDPWLDGGFKRMSAGMNRESRRPSPESRHSFWRAFGITPDMQTALEEMWETVSIDPSVREQATPAYPVQLEIFE